MALWNSSWTQILFTIALISAVQSEFEALNRARQWHCHALCTISKWLDSDGISYGQTRFRDLITSSDQRNIYSPIYASTCVYTSLRINLWLRHWQVTTKVTYDTIRTYDSRRLSYKRRQTTDRRSHVQMAELVYSQRNATMQHQIYTWDFIFCNVICFVIYLFNGHIGLSVFLYSSK